jgi:hypothetical protein
VSRDLTTPVTPVAVNGVVFALASGEAIARGQKSTPAVLYALDAAKQGTLDERHDDHGIGARRRSLGRRQPSLRGDHRRHLYTFGMPMER